MIFAATLGFAPPATVRELEATCLEQDGVWATYLSLRCGRELVERIIADGLARVEVSVVREVLVHASRGDLRAPWRWHPQEGRTECYLGRPRIRPHAVLSRCMLLCFEPIQGRAHLAAWGSR